MKYIIVTTSMGIECAILFDEILSHHTVAEDKPVVSAGFCELHRGDGEARWDNFGRRIDVEASVWGKSVSLGVESRETDAKLIETALLRRT